MAGNNSIQITRGQSAQRLSLTETSLVGQPIYELDTHRLFIGDGVTPINKLSPINDYPIRMFNTQDDLSKYSIGQIVNNINIMGGGGARLPKSW